MKMCKTCLTPMKGVMSFSKEKNEKFQKCPKCHSETRHRKIKDNELSFGEELNKAITNRKQTNIRGGHYDNRTNRSNRTVFKGVLQGRL